MSMPFFIINSFSLKIIPVIPFKNHFIRWCKVIQAGKKNQSQKFGICLAENLRYN